MDSATVGIRRVPRLRRPLRLLPPVRPDTVPVAGGSLATGVLFGTTSLLGVDRREAIGIGLAEKVAS